ncbi:MAG TPA: tape measure protein [Bacteroidota bacterium]|nr:tape measure protein [Bacteroidota bacterium]
MDQKRNIAWKFLADFRDFLGGAKQGKQGLAEMTREAEKLELSADQVRERMEQLTREIESMKDVQAIRQKQAELRSLGEQLDVINGKSREVVDAATQVPNSVGATMKAVFGGAFFANVADRGLGMVLGAVGSIKDAMIEGNAEMEQYRASFETMLGSVEKADVLMNEIKQFGAETPFEFPGLAQNAQLLKSFGVDAQEIIPTLRMLGDVSGGSQEKLNGLALVFAQVRSAGKLQGQDLMQLINQGFNPLEAISKRTGKSMGELKDEMSKGKISFDMVLQSFKDVTSEGGQFFGMMQKQSQTFTGLKSTLQDTLGEIGRDIGKPLFDAAKEGLVKVLETLQNPDTQEAIRSAAQRFGDLFRIIMDNKDIIAAIAGAWAVYAAHQKLATGELNKFFTALKMNPYAVVAAGVLAAIVALREYAKESGKIHANALKEADAQIELTKRAKENTEARKAQAEKNLGLMKSYEELGKKVNRTKEEEAQYRDALGKLQATYPGVVSAGSSFEKNLEAIRNLAVKTKTEIAGLTVEISSLDKRGRMETMNRAGVAVDAAWEKIENKLRESHTKILDIVDLTDDSYIYQLRDEVAAVIQGTMTEAELAQAALVATDNFRKRTKGLSSADHNDYMKMIDEMVKAQTEFIKITNAGGVDQEATRKAQEQAAQAKATEDEKARKEREKRSKEEMDRKLLVFKREREIEQKEAQNAGASAQRLHALKLAQAEGELEIMRLYAKRFAGAREEIEAKEHELRLLRLDKLASSEQSKADRMRKLRIDEMRDTLKRIDAEYEYKLDMLRREQLDEEEFAARKAVLDRERETALRERNNRLRELEISMMDDERKRLFAEYSYKRDLLRQEALDAEEYRMRELALEREYGMKILELGKKERDDKQKLREAEQEGLRRGFDVTMGIMDNLKSATRQGSAEYKALASSQATIAALVSANEAYKAGAAVPIVGMVLGPLAAAAALAQGFANVRAINSVKLAEGGILKKSVFVAGEAGEEAVTPIRKMPELIADSLEHVLRARFEQHPFYRKDSTIQADVRSSVAFSHFNRASTTAQFQTGRSFV